MNIGRYRVEHRIGEGPRGVVYKAFDAEKGGGKGAGKPGAVLIKVLHAHLCTDPRLEKSCQELSQTLRHLSHEHVTQILGVGGLPDGRIYLVSECVQGQ